MKLTQKIKIGIARQIIDMHRFDEEFFPQPLAVLNLITDRQLERVRRAKNPEYPNDPRHIQVWSEGRWQPYSWNKAITGRNDDLNKAMRASIAEDLQEFRIACKPQRCAICKTGRDLTTDHMIDSFKTIAADFLKGKKIDLVDGPPGGGKMFASQDVEADWIAYHASRATYQLLCRSCNSSKGARDVD